MSTQLISGVARSAMLVDMNVAVYSGRKQDKSSQAEVLSKNSAQSKKAASVYKNLFADCKELEEITKFQARARARHYQWTIPWSDQGARLLPTKALMRYKQDMNRYIAEFERLVEVFLDKYDTLVAAAAFQLGSLFDRSEYPAREQVAKRFRMDISMFPLPLSGDFRLDVEAEVQRELIEQYERKLTTQIEQANRDLWDRLHEKLKRLSDRLATDENGKGKTFHATTVTGAIEMCDLLSTLNITNDPKLESARRQLEQVLSGVDAAELRKSDGHRVEVKQKVDEILDAFDWGDDDN